ncbi:hypothetical protein QJS10_CPA07g00006 [Acorus calamus]|uniref:Uncharacterized protein n=1 Tax=Acorus calamus TaxID=4465 RepID=A0AAV9EFA6_ACOCL|nr:hypothetical protein QJS10_CPA07g00006 [Acorus calamus]
MVYGLQKEVPRRELVSLSGLFKENSSSLDLAYANDFLEAITLIGKDEGIKGFWKGNLPQLIRIVPYSAAQLFAYEVYKVTYPLDVLRLRLAVEPGSRTMSQVGLSMLRDEGIASFYSGLGPSLLGIAPYIAVNFCIFDLVKKSLPEKYQKKPQSSLATALVSATLATLMCYPLDTVRRQMQMRGSPYRTVFDAIPDFIHFSAPFGDDKQGFNEIHIRAGRLQGMYLMYPTYKCSYPLICEHKAEFLLDRDSVHKHIKVK